MKTPYIFHVFDTKPTSETMTILLYMIYDNIMYILYDKCLIFIFRTCCDICYVCISLVSILMYIGFLIFYMLYFLCEFLPVVIYEVVPAGDVRSIFSNLINKYRI